MKLLSSALKGFVFLVLFMRSAFALEPGLSHALAIQRFAQLQKISYELDFKIPSQALAKIEATAKIRFFLNETGTPVVLDFKGEASDILGASINEQKVDVSYEHQHLVFSKHLKKGENTILLNYRALPDSLHRAPEFVYTLLVPDRASQLFPCFDQPDLKAHFTLHLDLPQDWVGVANEKMLKSEIVNERLSISFATTPLQSTYLFAFAAGKFKIMSKTQSGRLMNLYYRESDDKKVNSNTEKIFSLHQLTLEKLEQYTGIPYPNSKLDFVLLPAFPFSGMEHPGAIFYKEESLFLDSTATTNQFMSRATTIAHEVSHQWFGNLVTMKWFEDVWLKEVMANFFAAKVTDPLFPQFNHQLKFYAQHFPGAYAIDRSEGANAIRQDLDNLQNAGSLYGGIIYLKAPILMRQLEELMGPVPFRAGVREYLKRFQRSNASWTDLISILGARTDVPLRKWSKNWIESSGRPEILGNFKDGKEVISQMDPEHKQRVWIQKFKVASLSGTKTQIPLLLNTASKSVSISSGQGHLLLNADGLGYGFFRLDAGTKAFLFQNINQLEDPLVRMVAWSALWDDFYETRKNLTEIEKIAFDALEAEKDEIVKTDILTHFSELYWRFMTKDERTRCQTRWEESLWSLVFSAKTQELKALYFNQLISLAETPEAISHLEKVLRREIEIPGLPVNEADEVKIAHALAIRSPARAEETLKLEERRIQDTDRKAEFAFTRPAYSENEKVRKDFFESLKNPENRKREVWVLNALQSIGHPLRPNNQFMVKPALDWLADIQRTNTLFFPGNWLNSILMGQRSPESAKIVRDFLATNPSYPIDLKQKILQAADILFRSLKRPEAK